VATGRTSSATPTSFTEPELAVGRHRDGSATMNRPRLPLVPEDIAEPRALVEAFRARRPGGALNEADRVVLNAPAFARGWNELARAVRHELSLPPRLRELVICAVGVLNGARYEVEKHAPVFLSAGGSPAQLAALEDIAVASDDEALFDTIERSALRLAIQMTRDVAVEDAVFEAVRAALPDPEQIVELVGTIAMYNMVSRLLIALRID
jgi:alkylhydroperoxidase family enzyme